MRHADMVYLQQLGFEKRMEEHRRSTAEKFQEIARREEELIKQVDAKPKTVDGVVYTEVPVQVRRFGYYEDEEEGR